MCTLLLPALLLAWHVGAARGTLPPQLNVGGEVVVRTLDNKTLELRCEGAQRLHWTWNSSLPFDAAEIEDKQRDNSTYPHESILKVQEMYIEDTGFYYCYYDTVSDLTQDTDQVANTYIYVYDGESIFVHADHTAQYVSTDEKLVLDCRTTLPNTTLSLTKDGEDITLRPLWDPKVGFVLLNIKIQDSGLYTCSFDATGSEQTIHVIVRPASKKLPTPSIDRGPNSHYVVGHSFSLNCMLVKEQVEVLLHWSYPKAGVTYHTNTTTMGEGNNLSLIKTLYVPEASTEDTGDYTCTATAKEYNEAKNHVYVFVKDKLEPYVNISSTDKITVNQSQTLMWKANVYSFPPNPAIVYTNWQGDILEESDRIVIEFQPDTSSSWLRIYNVTSRDFGDYTISATTMDGATTNNVTTTIEIMSAPSVEVKGVPEYLSKGMNLNINCTVQGFPVASTVWEFKSCVNGPSCSDFDNLGGDVSLQHPAPGNTVVSMKSLKVTSSGWLRCVANNSLGRKEGTVAVSISDIGGLLVLRHNSLNIPQDVTSPGVTVITNDDFLLLCGANKLHYRNVTLQGPHHNAVQVHETKSEYSFLREVVMKRASKVLQGRYACRAERHDDRGHDTKNVTITVVEETAVTFLQDSNMRMNETVIVEENEPYSLNCTVAGTPDPDVTWEKDGTPLTPDSPFFDGKTAALSDDHRRLELKYVFKDQHVGEYRCTARNRVNEVTGKLILTVPAAGLSTTAKVGLAVALLGIAILIITVVFLMRRVKTERRFRKSFRANELYLFEKGNIGQLNPDCSADEQAELLPYGQEWEVPRDQITLGKQLGSGAFGRVVKASVTGIEGPAATIVAIKTCKTQADASQVRALTLELKIMVHLGKHLNIVNLMGASTVHIGKGELWILVEYCRFGNLLVFMHRHRNNFINQIDPNTGRIDPSLLTADPNTLFSPLPPGVSSWRQTNSRGSHASFSQTPNTPIALSAPPPGHNGPLNHNNVHNPGTQQAHNPLYNAGIRGSMTGGGIVEAQNTNTTPPGAASSDATESCGSDGRTSDTTSSGQERGQQNAYYTSTMGSEGTQAPMSPAEHRLSTRAELVDSLGNTFVHEVGSVPGVNAPFTTSDLVCWSWQVAHGMEYLASRRVLHGDLAARNLLLADDNVVKISDFGLSRDIYKNDVYMKKADDLMPIKWISVEAIRDRIFSVQSDVWAFGVTLWEIFSLGSTPYPGIEVNQDFLKLLEDGYRMACPKYSNQDIYNLLLDCWEFDPRGRPSFRDALHRLDTMMQADIKGEYIDMNDQYMRMNEERFKEQTDYLNMFTPPEYENMTNTPEDDDVKPHYVNMEVAGGRRSTVGQASIHSPEVVSYCNLDTLSPKSPPPANTYLPMSSTRGSPSPEKATIISPEVFSPSPILPLKFTFEQDEKNTSSAGINNTDKAYLNLAEVKDKGSDAEHAALITNGGQTT